MEKYHLRERFHMRDQSWQWRSANTNRINITNKVNIDKICPKKSCNFLQDGHEGISPTNYKPLPTVLKPLSR